MNFNLVAPPPLNLMSQMDSLRQNYKKALYFF